MLLYETGAKTIGCIINGYANERICDYNKNLINKMALYTLLHCTLTSNHTSKWQ